MNEVPETTFEQIKLVSKKGSYARTKSAEPREIAQCAEGDRLRQLYDSTLEEWRIQSQPHHLPFLEIGAPERQVLQLREEALTKRNAAANRMYLHRASCAICRRRR